MSQFTEWLQAMEKKVSAYELQIILSELNTNQVALKANGVIPITYSVLTSVREVTLRKYYLISENFEVCSVIN